MTEIKLIEHPDDSDWMAVKERALVTVGLRGKTPPTDEWKTAILKARHSPIRRLRFSFALINIPYFVTVHLARHIHAQPYIRSQRNDRQTMYNRNAARQDQPVNMIWDMNGEEIQIVANKRLCRKASPETRAVVRKMVELVVERCPEFEEVLVPACMYSGCHEMQPCGKD